jgi:hypothetical protein
MVRLEELNNSTNNFPATAQFESYFKTHNQAQNN